MDTLPVEITTYILNYRYNDCMYKGSSEDYLNGMLVCIEWYEILRSHVTYIRMRNAVRALSGLGGYAIRRCARFAFRKQMENIKAVVESMGYNTTVVHNDRYDRCSIQIQSGNNNLRLMQTVSQGCFAVNYNIHKNQDIYLKHHNIAESIRESTDPLLIFTRNVLTAVDEHL